MKRLIITTALIFVFTGSAYARANEEKTPRVSELYEICNDKKRDALCRSYLNGAFHMYLAMKIVVGVASKGEFVLSCDDGTMSANNLRRDLLKYSKGVKERSMDISTVEMLIKTLGKAECKGSAIDVDIENRESAMLELGKTATPVSRAYEICKDKNRDALCRRYISGAMHMFSAMNMFMYTFTGGKVFLRCLTKGKITVGTMTQTLFKYEKTLMKSEGGKKDIPAVMLIYLILADRSNCR